MYLLISFISCITAVFLVSSLSIKTRLGNRCQKCDCKWADYKYVANCSSKDLIEVPDFLPGFIRILDLSNNELNQLKNDDFSKAYLENVYELMMKNCSIKTVADLAFKGMLILKTLDLSRNKISNLSDNVFEDNKDLRRIYLSYNKIKIISGDLFIDVVNLEEIFLDNNEIEFVNYSSFGHLTKLKQLTLQRNNLKNLDLDLKHLNRLTDLTIGGNPWVCDCYLEPIKNKAEEIGVDLSQVVCDSPPIYKGSSWRGHWIVDCFPSIEVPKVLGTQIIRDEARIEGIITLFCVIILINIMVIIGALVCCYKPKNNYNLNSINPYSQDDGAEEELQEVDSRQIEKGEFDSLLGGLYKHKVPSISSKRGSEESSIELSKIPPDL